MTKRKSALKTLLEAENAKYYEELAEKRLTKLVSEEFVLKTVFPPKRNNKFSF